MRSRWRSCLAFKVADEQGLALTTSTTSRRGSSHREHAETLTSIWQRHKQSVGSIQRSLLQLRSQSGDHFFGEPALDLKDFIGHDSDGRGIVNILAADRLMASPRLYATFLLWLLSELFEELPEVGDSDKPVLCFFFDEAHLLFDDAPPGLLEKVEQVVRLIRSKGVGIYFITQNPIDIPDKVAAQLGNRIQHKLNAFTPPTSARSTAASDTPDQNPYIYVSRRSPTEDREPWFAAPAAEPRRPCGGLTSLRHPSRAYHTGEDGNITSRPTHRRKYDECSPRGARRCSRQDGEAAASAAARPLH